MAIAGYPVRDYERLEHADNEIAPTGDQTLQTRL